MSIDLGCFAVDLVAEGRQLDKRDGKHAGRSAQPGLHLVEISLCGSGRITVPAQVRIDREQLLIAEAGIGIERVLRRADQEASHDKQHATCGNLRADEDLARDGLVLALARDLQRRHEAEEECSSET